MLNQIKKTTPDERKNLTTVNIAVWGLGCPNCAARVRNGLLDLNGVVEADVDHTSGLAFVEYSPELASIPSLLQAVSKAGNDDRHEYTAMLLEEATL